jgi:hypothetical protein
MAAISPQQEKQQQPEYIFVALYDFHGSSDGSQLSLRRGDQVFHRFVFK